jgi:uncharacterized membrane protein YjdF
MKETKVPDPKPVLAFTGLYVVALVVVGRDAGGTQLGIYLGLMALLVPVFYGVHRRHPLSAPLLGCLSVWGLLHMAGGLLQSPDAWFRDGDFPLLYSWWLLPGRLRYDQVVHAYGFGLTAWLCWHLLKSALRAPGGGPLRPNWAVLGLCVVAGIGFGALNETVEFITTRFLPETGIGDYENTGWDLVANLVGAVVAVLAIRWKESPGRR